MTRSSAAVSYRLLAVVAFLPLLVIACLRDEPVRPNVGRELSAGLTSFTTFSCLSQGGPLVTLAGVQTLPYSNAGLADSTKVDARGAQWIDLPGASGWFHATQIGGGANLCWSGGEALDTFPPSTPWGTMRYRTAHRVPTAGAEVDIEDARLFNFGRGIWMDPGGANWSIRRVRATYQRAAPCVSNNAYHSGTIEASFFDGCSTGVSSRDETLGDSSANLVVIRSSLMRLQVMDGSYSTPVPKQGGFWEWHPNAPRLALYDNVFRADAHAGEGPADRIFMAPPPGKIADCANNIMVWLGSGPFPEPLPACFTLRTDVAAWDSAVAAWNAALPPPLPDVSPPIVSLFQPGITGSTNFAGQVTLWATAVDDRAVVGVQFELDGTSIGAEQTSPTPYVGADPLRNRDLTTKYEILWNSASVPNGTHILRARARDAAGHTTTSAGVTVTVSNVGQYHASPTGTPTGDGSAANPWDLATALAGGHGAVQPGHTIWLHGGTYQGAFTATTALSGTSAARIVVRQYPGERAILDGASLGPTDDVLRIDGQWVTFWGFEIMSSFPDRGLDRPSGIFITNSARSVRLLNLVIHDVDMGLFHDQGAAGCEIVGVILYNNGWQGSKDNGAGHGHALYVQSDVGPVTLRDNVLFNQYSYGVHAYADHGAGLLKRITLDGNASFNNGSIDTVMNGNAARNILLGGGDPAGADTVRDNMTYFSYAGAWINVGIGYDTTSNEDIVFTGNYVAGGTRVLEFRQWAQATVSGNVLYGPDRIIHLEDTTLAGWSWGGNTHHRNPAATAWLWKVNRTFVDWQNSTGLGGTDAATATVPSNRVFVRPNPYEPGRGHVIVYNWTLQGSVNADLSSVLAVGDSFEVRSVQNLFDGSPVMVGRYGGGLMTIPMMGITPADPVGTPHRTPPTTGPQFDVFLVRRVGG